MKNNNTCQTCIWNNNCYIQSAIKNYMRYNHSRIKIDLSDFYCINYEQIPVEIPPGLTLPEKENTEYLNFYSSE